MNRTKQITILSAILALLLLLAVVGVSVLGRDSAVTQETAARSPEPLDLGPVIATVDGEPIYLGEAKARVDGLTTLHGDLAAGLGEDWHDLVLDSLVSDKVQLAEAKDLGMEVTDSDIQSAVADVTAVLGEGQTLDGWLVDRGISYGEFVRRIRLQIVGSRVMAAVTEDVTVTGQEIRNYYRANPTEFQGADGHVSALLEVRNSIRDSLLKQKQEEAYAAWLEKTKSDADVQVVIEDWWKDLT